MKHQLVKVLFVVGAIAAVLFVVGPLWWFADSTTTQSLSPNEEYRIYLIEGMPNMPLKIDRNFKVVLATLSEHGHGEIARETVFTSPDEGKPIGSERFIWSKDSTYVLLVGRHFGVATDLPLGQGEQAYLLYHLPSKRSWVNTDQVRGGHTLTERELLEIDFAQPVTLEK